MKNQNDQTFWQTLKRRLCYTDECAIMQIEIVGGETHSKIKMFEFG